MEPSYPIFQRAMLGILRSKKITLPCLNSHTNVAYSSLTPLNGSARMLSMTQQFWK